VWQENFRKNKARRLAAEFGEHFAKGMMAVRFQQCLYRAIIDTSLVNRAARKIWKRCLRTLKRCAGTVLASAGCSVRCPQRIVFDAALS